MLSAAIRAIHPVAAVRKRNTAFLTGIGFAVITSECWFVVKGVDLRGPAVHEQKDHAFCSGREPCKSRRQWAAPLTSEGWALVGHRPLAQEAVQGQSAKAS